MRDRAKRSIALSAMDGVAEKESGAEHCRYHTDILERARGMLKDEMVSTTTAEVGEMYLDGKKVPKSESYHSLSI